VILVDWKDWQPFYLDIVSRLDLNPEEDLKATLVLDSMLQNIKLNSLLDNLRLTIENKIIIVCGAGPSLDKHLQAIESSDLVNDAVFIAADGAASALREYRYDCQIIVTDLDGNLNDILGFAKQGAIPIVHAHGDNIDKIREFVPKFEYVIGSTQVEPTSRVLLWGGFTDGDRACYIASHYNPERILLIGMDFGSMVGRWSKPEHTSAFQASERKRIKLKIAKELIMHLNSNWGIEIDFME
jgi:uncharacterized Rossmann fold enzyme